MKKINKSIIFSSMQPTGKLTIGNYTGALLNWISLQKENNCIYSISDLHAMTAHKNIKNIYKKSLDTLSCYLACGIDPDKSIIFLQSDVYQHIQLYWILNCHTYFGELKRMNQFKSKIKIFCKNNINVGLFNYPILMASDILLYNTKKVPIGKDQIQHLELVRKISKRLNNKYGKIFSIPEYIISKTGSKIMSLRNPKKKMSKSDCNKNSTIFLLDSKENLIQKIKKSITDSDISQSVKYDYLNKPGISNLISLLSSIKKISISKIEKKFYGKSYSIFKDYLIEYLSKFLTSFQEKYYFFRSNETFLKKVLINGAEKASIKANLMLKNIFNKIK